MSYAGILNMAQRRRISVWIRIAVCLFVAALWLAGSWAMAEAKESFNRDVRPILGKRCLHCHGADEETREADLRLDTAEGAYADLGGYHAIVPGKPEESEVVRRIFSSDEDERMPPADSKIELADAEKEILRRWIAQGARYEKHWAFVAPRRPQPPAVEQTSFVKNPIDNFVLARIEQAGLAPAPEADRYTLVRRLYLDLIGLPPTRQQVDAFVRDDRPDAYERLVDQLLASAHYGERWARLWLDLARYADTNGYEKDRPRPIWPYRDWVIHALNNDMPFDQFTIEQIAGDMLPDATLEQKIATGFHRNTMLNEEGGVEVEQFRFESIIDRVNTTGTVWLGLTVGCARCHTHKYDPITQTEYYRMFAFLNNADEPELELPDPEITGRRQQALQKIDQLEHELASHWPASTDADSSQSSLDEKFQAWQAEKKGLLAHWTPLAPVKTSAKKGTTFTLLDDLSLLAGGNRPNNDVYTIELETDLPRVTALKLEVLPHESLPDGGPGRSPLEVDTRVNRGDFLLSEFEATTVPRNGGEPTPLALQNPTSSYATPKSSAEKTLDGNLDTGWRIAGQVGKENHVVYQLAKPLVQPGGKRLIIRIHQNYIHNMTIGRFRLSVTSDPLPVVSSGLPTKVELALSTPEPQRTDEQRWQIKRRFLLTAKELAEQQKQIEQLRKQMPQYERTLVMQERLPQNARHTHRHHRGQYLKPREEVQPGVPAMLHPLPKDAPRNRLTFARWLVDPHNPLVGRVVMNRQWQAFFGKGIVRTTEDFGTQSSPPTHPKLLDWLATEFIRRGWSMKQMHRLIVTSATYRQQSRITPELLEKDPENLLLARGPRFRVEAETIRDIALTASGLLSEKIGGPSVFPPQPKGVTSLSYGQLTWKTSEGPDRYRRGLYTFAKRTTPYAMFGTFDGPSGNTCVVRRSRSNTPLQALTLLNDSSFVEAAQTLARQELTDGPPTAEARIIDIFNRFLTRAPDDQEQAAILKFYHEQLARFRAGKLDAAEVAGVAADALPEHVDLAELAAWTTVVRAVLNFDETITKG